MGRFAELEKHGIKVDLDRRLVSVENSDYSIPLGSQGLEQVVASIPAAFSSCDAYAAFHGDNGALGATLKLYGIQGSARVLLASTIIGSVTSGGALLAVAGRGCDKFELAIVPAAAAPNQSTGWDFYLCSFDGTSTDAALAPNNGGGTPGASSFSRIRGSSGVVKNAPGQLLFTYANFDTAGAGGTRWLMFFDATALPANGTAPAIAALPLPAVDTVASVDLTSAQDPASAPGKAFATGIVWAISSTKGTLTIDNASTFDVETKFQ